MSPDAKRRMEVYQEGQRAFNGNRPCPYHVADWRNKTWRKGLNAAREHYADILREASESTGEELPEAEPVNMILYCPKCGAQHIDEPERSLGPGNTERLDWDNPPHRSHLCHGCGTIWRPADVPTNGVRTLETFGKADTWPPTIAP